MSYQLSYDADSRLIVSGVDCDCGCVHNSPEQDIYVGSGIVSNIARYIRKRNLGQRCVLVADNITWEVAGRRVHQLLTEGGFGVIDCIIRRDGNCPEIILCDLDILKTAPMEMICSTCPCTAPRTTAPATPCSSCWMNAACWKNT